MKVAKRILISVHRSLSGIEFVKVWEAGDLVCPNFLRRIQLDRFQQKIVFSTVLSNKKILIADRLAKVRVINISDGNTVLEKDFQGTGDCSAKITEDRQSLYLAYTQGKNDQKVIVQLNLINLDITDQISLPDAAVFNPFWKISSHLFYVYFQSGGDLNDRVEDGLYKLDMSKKIIHSSVFSEQSNTFESQPLIAISEKYKIGARLDYSNIEIKATSGRKKYLAKIQIFELSNCKPLSTIEVREFFPEHVFEDIDPELALSNLELPVEEEEFQEAQSEFLERITSINFCHHEKALWIAFQHGLIRKIFLEDGRQSPLFAYPLRGLTNYDPYQLAGFNNTIILSDDDQQIGFGYPRVDLPVKELDLESDLTLIPVPDKYYERSIHVTTEEDIEITSWNIFEVAQSDIFEILKEITEKVTLRTLKIDGDYLRVKFKVKNEMLSEEEFFQLIQHKTGWEQITEQYLIELIKFNQPLYSAHLVPVGFSAIRLLVDHSDSYHNLLNRYLSSNVIPEECPLTELSKFLNQGPPWSQLKMELVLNYALYPDSPGFEMLQDYLITSEFSEFIHSDEINNIFLNHPLILELRDDLFNLLHPLEDQLFEAISWGNLDKVKELTDKGADLNCSHPDFKYSALMCAIELDNDEIAKFLVQHGANIEQSDILN